ncbi:hypothetical protein LX97_00573 [Nonlabens dokdonensis]|uniref:Lipoprotein n=2 Tax=Nonlabens dokdonensis TaxID=328515 RepID=L7W324_NONDD|nr:DUF6702 family protein [Nonlabens dokdonensis]AGC75890.1 hypothetical protein DDD_0763 [Nonlabens dokdonensis DSW-6]PZX43572.1 hypothetical protein LX97_00573 [Nonlabens dokdonensis]
MKRALSVIIVFLFSVVACAHNPLSARYTLVSDKNACVLEISLSQDGINQALINTYGKDFMTNMDSKAFKELIVNYIKEHFDLRIDNRKLELSEGGIRLGGHQTDLKFVLDPIKDNIKIIEVAIPAFKENGEHQSIFSYTINSLHDRAIISSRNDYQTVFYPNGAPSRLPWLVGGFAGLIAIIIAIYLIRRKRVTA